jgi:hypothetical protein
VIKFGTGRMKHVRFANSYKIVVTEAYHKRLHWRHMYRWENIVEMDPRKHSIGT